MRSTTLIIPGLHGSGPAHWQSWFCSQLHDAQRVQQQDWNRPVLEDWSNSVQQAVLQAYQQTNGPLNPQQSQHAIQSPRTKSLSNQVSDQVPSVVWLVAHSFGCLATVAAIARLSDAVKEHIAGVLLVAPADPDRFATDGSYAGQGDSRQPFISTIAHLLPQASLDCPSVVVISDNDPWMPALKARHWARRWGSHCIELKGAGHINAEAGFGPWPQGLSLYRALRAFNSSRPRASALKQPTESIELVKSTERPTHSFSNA